MSLTTLYAALKRRNFSNFCFVNNLYFLALNSDAYIAFDSETINVMSHVLKDCVVDVAVVKK